MGEEKHMNNPTTIGRRIKIQRERLKLTQEELALKLGYKSRSTINKIEIGENDISQSKVFDFAKALLTTPAFLMGWDEDISDLGHHDTNKNASYYNIPLYESLSCGNGIFVNDNVIEYITLPESLLSVNKQYFCQYAVGDSMVNENINEGDLLVFEKTQVIENGQIGCFCIDDNMATCKKFYKDSASAIITLQPANPKYAPIIVTIETMNFHVVGKLRLVINKRD